MAKMSSVVDIILGLLVSIVNVSVGDKCWYGDGFYKRHVNCPHNDCCGDSYYMYCCNHGDHSSKTSSGSIVGAVLGSVVSVVIVCSIAACCFCSFCPLYRYRKQEKLGIATHKGPSYQTMPNAPYPPNTGVQQNSTAAPPPQNQVTYTTKPADVYPEAPPPYEV